MANTAGINVLQNSLGGQPEGSVGAKEEIVKDDVLNETEETDGEETTDSKEETFASDKNSDKDTADNFIENLSPEAQKHFKTLQTKLTKRTEGYNKLKSDFDSFGGAEQAIEWLRYLADNKDFAKWVDEQKSRKTLGVTDDDGLDDDTRRAMDIVRKLAREEAERMVAPLTQAQSKAHINEVMSQMDTKYPGWQAYKESMGELAESFPESIQNNPSLKNLETLYFMAINESGKMDEYAAKSYEKKLKSMKDKTINKPTSTPAIEGFKKAKTLREAFEIAKKKLDY